MSQDTAPEAPPETERRPVTETLHDVEIEDPYRWLEADDDEVQEWVAAQNEFTDARLAGETRERLHPRLSALSAITDYGPVTVRGGVHFQQIEAPDEDHPVLYVREDLGEDANGDGDGGDGKRALVDPNEWDGASLDWFVPSPDGDLVAYGKAEGGTEQYDIFVIDLDGEAVDRVESVGRGGGIAWTDDGFYYMATGGADGEGSQLDKEVRFHEVGTDGADRRFDLEMGERTWPGTSTADDGTLVLSLEEMSLRSDVYVMGPDDDEPRPAITGYDASFHPAARGDTVYVHTDYGADNWRLLAAPVEQFREGDLDPDALREAVPEHEDVLAGVAVTDAGVVAHHRRDANSTLSVYEDGERVREIDLPEHSSVRGLEGEHDGAAAFYLVEGFDRPTAVVRLDPETGERETVERQTVAVDVDFEIEVEQAFFESDDGTKVPAYVVHRADLATPAPAVVYGYGGFRNSLTPGFDRYRLPFLRAGGVWVQANLRGGSEYGEAWHRAGMRERKQNVFDDLYAVAEGVVDDGVADPDALAVQGGSNGGLLVGAAITQRPDLWTAAVCGVPLLDMLRFHRFLLGEAWTNEYGSPDDPDAFEYLRAYSPYHNVFAEDAAAYPDTLLWTAAGDTRVHPSHARKMAALLQDVSEGEVLLRTITETGHGVGTPTEVTVRRLLDQQTFLFDRLGLTAPAPPAE